MGTISDKLMRIINTKEDIRRALISKGYDVPTSIPFKEYAKMILDLPCNADSFPDIEGIVARYSALDLTNEQMAENPVWKDLTGNGHDLQMKNFAWKGMSGVGGYGDENYRTFYKFTLDDYVFIASPPGVKHMNFTFRVTGLQPGNKLTLAFFGTTNTVYGTWDKDGIYTVNSAVVEVGKPVYFYNGYGATRGEFTIEILPLYPGFILGDGVDDFAVTEKEFNFEDTYTVYTAFIPFQNDPANNMVLCGKNHLKDFYITYSDLNHITFYSAEKLVFESLSKGFNILCCKRTPDKMVIKNLITDKSSEILANDLIDNPGLYYLWKGAVFANYAKAAIAGQTICNGYFSTDEDDEKVLNWYKKQYPWLFPDQAWTVTGKTNEDEDRATIANITGNGNGLNLSNFGFAEGSGYGLYAYNFNSFNLKDNVVKPTDVKKDSFRIIGTGDNSNVLVLSNTSNSADWKIRITGMKEGDRCLIGNANKSGEYISVNKDGTYTFQKQYAATSTNGIWYNSSQEVDVLVEQIPEHEGYLITDGVDDKVESEPFTIFNKYWTIVGNWTMLSNIPSNCGIIKALSTFLYNSLDGVTIYFERGPIKIQSKSFNAFCSDGRVYLNDWTEILTPDAQITSCGYKSSLNIASYSAKFTKMAFKNLAIYEGKNLSKDECIKAYNYLQTLKSK